MRHVVTDSSDEAQVRKAEEQAEDEDKDILFLMNSERGRRWVYNLTRGTCHIASLSLVPGDKHSTAFNEGARSVGLALDAAVARVSPALHLKMLEENHYG